MAPSALPTQEFLRRLASRVDQLEAPVDYYISGVGFFNGALPQNLICFARRDPQDLRRSGVRFHHHRWVFVAALQGVGRIHIDDMEFRLSAGSALVIQPFQFHTFSDVDGAINWLFISFEMPEDEGRLRVQRTQELDRLDVELLEGCLQSWREEGKAHLSPLYLALLWSRLNARPDVIEEVHNVTSQSALLLRINELISKRPHQPYGIKELAAALGISESHLRARFRAATGRSIGKHMRDLRIRHACRLLLSSNETVGQIADRCGFQNLFAFSRAFSAAVKQSPSEYRRQNLL